MRILVIGRSLPCKNSSSGLFEYEQAVALHQVGQDVVYVCSVNDSIRTNRSIGTIDQQKNGMRCIVRSFPVGHRLRRLYYRIKTNALMKILKTLVDEGWVPDLVYAHFPVLTLTPSFINLLGELDIPLVCMEHWSRVQARAIDGPTLKLLTHAVESSASFCCVSEHLRDSISELIGASEDNLKVLPNMVDEALFNTSDRAIAWSYGGTPTFVSCGRLVKSKRVDHIIQALAIANQETPMKLVIVGDGDERGRLERLAKKLGIMNVCEFIGWKSAEEVAAVLRRASCYVSASAFETFCVPVVEAWMCGIPCLVPYMNPLRQYFDEDNGVLYSGDDVRSLAQSMVMVVNRALRNNYDSESISRRARTLFSREVVLNELISLFEDTVMTNKHHGVSGGKSS